MKSTLRFAMIPLTLALACSAMFAQEGSGQPPSQRGGSRRGPDQAGAQSFSAKTLPKNDREKAVLEILEDMDRSQRRGSMSVPVDDGRFLRTLTEAVGAKHVVEIGTSIGFSGIWFCLALESTGGRLTTFEIDAQRAATARNNFKRAGVEKLVTLVEGDAHQEVTKIQGPVDVVFIDADKEGYADYLQKLLPKVRAGGLLIAHNINERMADPTFIKAITTNPDLETSFLNVGNSGISVSLKKK